MKYCVFCHQPATLAIQDRFTNNGKPVNPKTFQIRTKPTLCVHCVETKFQSYIITENPEQCKEIVLNLVKDQELFEKTIVFFRKSSSPQQDGEQQRGQSPL